MMNQNIQTHMVNQFQNFEPNPEIYTFVQPDHHHPTAPWQEQNRSLAVFDDSSLRCVFPCEGNERPSQGLSLSLNSNNPSSIGVQPFELRVQPFELRVQHDSKSMNMIQQQQQQYVFADGFLGKSTNFSDNNVQEGQFQIRGSKYLGPAQELLYEFCNLGTNQIDPPKLKPQGNTTNHEWVDDQSSTTSSSSKNPSLSTLELLELQKRKTKLFSLLEEVDRRYRHYCEQMKGVVLSFEAVTGKGAAKVYSAMASKAMSRHFRCLRDGIVGQIKGTKKAMGEKDSVSPAGVGTSSSSSPSSLRGETTTPRLRLLDQSLRQQRAFQQRSLMESHPWRPQRGLPEKSVSVLRAWLFEHFLHPYPSDVDKHILSRQTGLSRSQVSNWFINARVRLWKPMVEEMYLEETKEQLDNNNNNNNMVCPDGITTVDPADHRMGDQKPTPEQLIRIDSECLSSIINNNINNNNNSNKNHHSYSRLAEEEADAFGGEEDQLDFSSYGGSDENLNQNFGGVSLTLGLQQHGGSASGGMSLGFSPASFYSSRDSVEDCQQVSQYSLLDSTEAHNLPYRNLMGAQLLHDLAG